jgi:hypothetical protein
MQSVLNYPDAITIAGGNILFSAEGTHWEDIGHAMSFKAKVETEEKESVNSRNGLRRVAKTFITKLTASGTIECNFPSKENINKFFMGNTIASLSQSASSMVDQSFSVQLDKWRYVGYRDLTSVTVKAASTSFSAAGGFVADMGNAGDAVLDTPTFGANTQEGTYIVTYDTDHYVLEDPDGNLIPLSKVEGTAIYTSLELGFTVSAGSPIHDDEYTCVVAGAPSTVTMTLGTDYLLDAAEGLIWVKSTNGKGVIDDANVLVSATYGNKAWHRIDAGTKNAWKVHLWYKGNPLGGQKQEIKGYVNLKPSGELDAIGEEEQKFTFEFKFQENSAYVDGSGAVVLFQYFDFGSVG